MRPSPRSVLRAPRTPLLALLLVATLLVPTAHAQASDPTPPVGDGESQEGVDVDINGHVVWTTPHNVIGKLKIEPNASLEILGTVVRVKDLLLKRGGELRLRSLDNASAHITSSVRGDGWGGVLDGDVTVEGLPTAPAFFDAIRGTSSGQENRLLFQDGLYVTGTMRAEYLVVQQYSSGIYVNNFATVWLNHTLFASLTGTGLMGARGDMHLDHVGFQGAGAGVFVGTFARLFLEAGAFSGAPTPIVMNGVSAEMHDVRVEGAATCVTQFTGTLTIDGLTCTNFTTYGVRAIPAPPEALPTFRGSNLTLSTANATSDAGDGIYVGPIASFSLNDSTIGPVPARGAVLGGLLPDFKRVRFQGVQTFDVTILDPPTDPSPTDLWEGESGKAGWLQVRRHIPVSVVDQGSPAVGATVDIFGLHRDTPGVRQYTDDKGNVTVALDTLLVLPDKTVDPQPYKFAAVSADANRAATIPSVVPDQHGITLTLGQKSSIPFSLWIPLLAVAIVAALHRRMRQ